jgi:hypothetical protein
MVTVALCVKSGRLGFKDTHFELKYIRQKSLESLGRISLGKKHEQPFSSNSVDTKQSTWRKGYA